MRMFLGKFTANEMHMAGQTILLFHWQEENHHSSLCRRPVRSTALSCGTIRVGRDLESRQGAVGQRI
jgi:hypothetical protein